MRLVADHKYTKVEAMDERGPGNANHVYHIEQAMSGIPTLATTLIEFQNGPIKKAGLNGITNEDLLAIVIDRLSGFQMGEYKCRENAIALIRIEEAYMWLLRRTANREARGVEGTNVK